MGKYQMTFNDFQRAASLTARENPFKERILVQSLGLAGEAGEVANLVKKWAWHNGPLSPDQMADELADVLWYVADLASAMGLDLEAVALGNVEKLQRRYPAGFTADGGIRT